MVGAIASGIGAIATAFTIAITIWQVKRAEKKKLKVTISDSIAIYPAENEDTYILIKATNIGNRKMTIVNYGFLHNNRNSFGVLGYTNDCIEALYNTKLPCVVGLEETVRFLWNKKYFYQAIYKGTKEKKLLKTKKLVFFVEDSSGRKYEAKTPRYVGEYLAEIKIGVDD